MFSLSVGTCLVLAWIRAWKIVLACPQAKSDLESSTIVLAYLLIPPMASSQSWDRSSCDDDDPYWCVQIVT